MNGARLPMLEVGKDAGPVSNAALRARQPLLRFLELAFGSAHAQAPGFFKLWVCGHKGFQICRYGILDFSLIVSPSTMNFPYP